MVGKRHSLAALALLTATGCGRTAMEVQAGRRDASPEAAVASSHDAGSGADAADAPPPTVCLHTPSRYRQFGHDSGSSIQAVAVDDAGNVAITGSVRGTVDFGGGPLQPAQPDSSTTEDMFVATFDAGAQQLWSARFNASGTGIAFDKSGDVLVAGGFSGALDFGNGPLVADGTDAFLVMFSASGKAVWSRGFGDADKQEATAVATDDAGDIFLAGSGSGGIDLGCGTVSLQPPADAGPVKVPSLFAARFDNAGKCVWSRAFPSEPGNDGGFSFGPSLAVTPSGRPVIGIAGAASATDFGAGYQPGYCLAELEVDGTLRWTRCLSMGVANVAEAFDIAANAAGEVAVTGYTDSDYAPEYFSYAGVLDPSGHTEWLQQTTWEQFTEYATGVFAPPSGLLTGGAVNYDTSTGHVHAFRADGTELWSADLPKDFTAVASAADPAGNVWFGGSHGPWSGFPSDAALVEFKACPH